VALYKILQRAAVEAERQFEDLSRIGESFDEIKDCNSHIYTAAGKIRARILEILSSRFQELSTQRPNNDSSKEMQILRTFGMTILENILAVGGARYGSTDSIGLENTPLSVRALVVMLEMAGEVGKALVLHNDSSEHLLEASPTVVEDYLAETFRLRRNFAQLIPSILETLQIELPLEISGPHWRLRPLVFDSTQWMRLFELPGYWSYQDCLGTTVLHFLIEQLGSGTRGISHPVSSERRARFIAKMATQNLAKFEYTDNYNRTPLHVAAQWNVLDVATALLRAGVGPDRVTNTQRTALHYAASLGHSGMCNLLLDLGADINARTKGGNSPLMVALIRTDETYKTFLSHPNLALDILNDSGDTALHIAVHQGNTVAVKDLIPILEDSINEQNEDGQTAICVAAGLDNHEDAAQMVDLLLESEHLVPDLMDNNLMTPLHHAVMEGNYEVCKALALRIDGGLFIEWSGERPSELAEREGHVEIHKLLRKVEQRGHSRADTWGR